MVVTAPLAVEIASPNLGRIVGSACAKNSTESGSLICAVVIIMACSFLLLADICPF
jgi:hypothetical protein